MIDSEIAKARQQFVTADVQQLAGAELRLDTLVQQLAKAEHKVKGMTLRAPVSGTIEASAVTTVGQVVKPSQQLMQVVPEGAALEIECYVLNTDIGFLKVGQHATIKLDTFPYTRYGTISGTVTRIAADAESGGWALGQQKNGSQPVARGALSETSAAEPTADLVFPVTIVPSKSTIKVDGSDVPLLSGMRSWSKYRPKKNARFVNFVSADTGTSC